MTKYLISALAMVAFSTTPSGASSPMLTDEEATPTKHCSNAPSAPLAEDAFIALTYSTDNAISPRGHSDKKASGTLYLGYGVYGANLVKSGESER